MSALKAIETEYKGYRFRSRLEARWAVFFDACGVKWEYEPEGYVLSGFLTVLDTGAYGYSMCSPYNSRPRPAEVLVKEDSSLQLIRRRETIEDLMAYM